MKSCLRCGKEFKEKGVGLKREKKFCSRTCQSKYNALKRYYSKLRYDPKYKKKVYKNFKKWIIKNREHFNDLVREKSRLNGVRLRNERRVKGCCVKCGKKLTKKDLNPKFKITCCVKCRIKKYKGRKKAKRRLKWWKRNKKI